MKAVKWGRVVICDTFGPGKSHLSPPFGGNLEFWLRPQFIQGADGTAYLANYAIDFTPGYAPDEWAGAIFTPMGSADVTGISGLPNWDKSNPTVCQAYQTAIDDQTKNNLGKSNTSRLESIVPYVSDAGKLGYNYLRLFYVENARQAPTKHLFVIKSVPAWISPGGVRALQDGSGHGPPS